MREIPKSSTFDAWFSRLRDRHAKARIAARIDRIYFTQRGPIFIVIFCCGDKRTQAADIKRAIEIAEKWSE